MRLRILTQNLYNGRADPASFAAVLSTHAPDVVAVQELSANAADVLADWGTHRLLDPRDDITGMGIAVRGEAVFERLEFPHRNPVLARLPADSWGFGFDVQVVNAHLVNPIARPIQESRRRRRAELAGLEGHLLNGQGAEVKVLVGDLNSSPAWPLYRRLSAVASDAAVEAGTARRTWGPLPSSPRLLRIDHAFIAGALRARSTSLVTVTGADHSGLLVEVESAL